MRPKTTREELPTAHVVRTKIINNFTNYLNDIRSAIRASPGTVSTNWDMWTQDQTSDPYFGMLGSWIDVSPASWTLRVEVLAFHIVIGAHDGENLGRYFVKFLDRAAITGRSYSKVNNIFNYEHIY
jgi:hypothetical protein